MSESARNRKQFRSGVSETVTANALYELFHPRPMPRQVYSKPHTYLPAGPKDCNRSAGPGSRTVPAGKKLVGGTEAGVPGSSSVKKKYAGKTVRRLRVPVVEVKRRTRSTVGSPPENQKSRKRKPGETNQLRALNGSVSAIAEAASRIAAKRNGSTSGTSVSAGAASRIAATENSAKNSSGRRKNGDADDPSWIVGVASRITATEKSTNNSGGIRKNGNANDPSA